MEKSIFPNIDKVIADGGVTGFAEYFFKFKASHPTYDSIYKEHNDYWQKQHEEFLKLESK